MGSNHARLVFSTALRRSGRRLVTERRRLVLLLASLLVATPAWYHGVRVVYRYSRAWEAGESAIPFADLLGGQLSVLTVLVVGLVALRTALEIGYPDEPDLVLLAASARDVATGLVLAEYVRVALVLGAPLTAVWTVFAIGTGAPLLVLTGGTTIAALLFACVLGGYLLGALATPAIRRVDRRTLYALLAVVVALALVGLERAASSLESIVEPLLEVRTPVSAYAELALLGSSAGSTGDPTSIVVAIAAAVALPIVLIGAIRTVVPAIWWRSSRRAADTEPTRAVALGRVPFGGRPSIRVARIQVLRAVRNPARLGHVFVAAFVVLPTVVAFVQEPLPVALLVGPPLLAVVTAWTAGALFCLNPIGDSAPMYSQLVLATVPDRSFVTGRMLAGLALTLPPATILLGVAGIAGPMTLSQTATLIAFTALASIWAAALACGLGCLVPATHRSTRADGRSVATPHLAVLGLYSFLVAVGGLIGLLLAYLPSAFRILLTSVSVETIQTWGGLALFASCTAITVLSYRYATVRFVRYELV